MNSLGKKQYKASWRFELYKDIEHNNLALGWVVFSSIIALTIVEYFITGQSDLINLGLITIPLFSILLWIKYNRTVKIDPTIIGVVPVLFLSLFLADLYSQTDVHSFKRVTLVYVVAFISCGIIGIWRTRYSAGIMGFTIAINGILFKMKGILDVQEMASNGGIFIILACLLMALVVQIRFYFLKIEAKNKTSLIQNQKKFTDLFQNTTDLIQFVEFDGSFQNTNNSWIKTLQFSSKEIESLTIFDVLHEDYHEPYREVVKQLSRGETLKKVEFIFLDKERKEHIVEGTVSLLKINKDHTLIQGVFKDLTEKRKAEEELKKSEEDYRILFDHNPTPMLIYSLDNLSILSVNDAMIVKYGYSKDQFLKMNITHFVALEKLYRLNDNFHTTNNKAGKASEWIHLTNKGNKINVKVTANSILHMNQNARILSFTDITELKRNQKLLIKAKREAEKSKELQSRFLSTMSHEIRTPMNGIIGMCNVVQDTKLNKEQGQYIETIKTSAENLTVIINDILDGAKIDSGKLNLENIPFSLSDQVQVWKNTLGELAKEKNIKFSIESNSELSELIKGDPVRLSQIIYNLGGNAIKFTKQGYVSISIKKEVISTKEVRIKFEIEDSGIGIPRTKLKTIFEDFTQASASTTREFGGTGLGLGISKKLVELHNSTLSVHSTEGVGSTFSFTISFDVVPKSTQKTIPLNDTQQEKEIDTQTTANILLVEDNEINSFLAKKIIEKWGFKVDTAFNGNSALNKVNKNDYDMILMDINMPDINGYKVTEFIRASESDKNNRTPIVAMTASAMKEEEKKCIDAGMNDYISKPFKPKDLFNKITMNLTGDTQVIEKAV